MKYLPDKRETKIIVSCEHGGNRVPPRFRELFKGRERMLNSHRGYDRYALVLAGELAQKLNAALFSSTVTRLLVDLNRSPHHRNLFSEISGQLDADEKEHIINKHYLSYRREVESCVSSAASKGIAILHLSVHSFAPLIGGVRKNADVGLLYDPSRYPEKALCVQWQKCIQKTDPLTRVRRNYPYLGKADGLITYLRRMFSSDMYIGIELEFNRKIMKRNMKYRRMLIDTCVSCMRSCRSCRLIF